MLFFGPELFALVFGDEWRKAGVYAQWMAPWIYLQFQWSPLSMLASVLELQKAALISQLLTFGIRFGVLLGAWVASVSADTSILIFAAASAVAYFFRMWWFLNKAEVRLNTWIKADLKYLAAALPVTFIVWLILQVEA